MNSTKFGVSVFIVLNEDGTPCKAFDNRNDARKFALMAGGSCTACDLVDMCKDCTYHLTIVEIPYMPERRE